MRCATGIDIVEVDRMEQAARRWGDLFLKRVFTPEELEYSLARKFPYQHLAARFAAKEAIFKAMGTDRSLAFRDIEIRKDSFGRPVCHIKNKVVNITVSVSHTKDYAVASAVLFEEK